MDPLSAIGLASSIVQFVDFATKLAYGARQIYVSGAGSTAENADVELCASELESLCTRLNSSTSPTPWSSDDEALCRLAGRCRAISNDLSTLLRKIKARNPESKWNCFVSAIKSQLHKAERDGLLRRLSECRAQLDIQLSRLARCVPV